MPPRAGCPRTLGLCRKLAFAIGSWRAAGNPAGIGSDISLDLRVLRAAGKLARRMHHRKLASLGTGCNAVVTDTRTYAHSRVFHN